ncbi:MAG: DUF364 domain-containing protein [Syntrophales bacterium]|nr:DUF364 domain-containing protein [Syntrophales bacterium]
MMQTGDISRHIHESVDDRSRDLQVEEVRIGLGYVGVMLEGGRTGLAAVLRHELRSGCSTLGRAGTLAGSGASELLDLLVTGTTPLEKTLGLATANALLCPDAEGEEQDSIALMGLTSGDRVAMVGYFGPLEERIKKTGAKLQIIENDPHRMEEIPDREGRDSILEECSVAIITATSILNDTIEGLLNGLGSPRHVTILGPSTPLCAEAFAKTPVTHLGGSAIRDHRKVMQIISEGGGTPKMRPYLRFMDRAIKHNAEI